MQFGMTVFQLCVTAETIKDSNISAKKECYNLSVPFLHLKQVLIELLRLLINSADLLQFSSDYQKSPVHSCHIDLILFSDHFTMQLVALDLGFQDLQ